MGLDVIPSKKAKDIVARRIFIFFFCFVVLFVVSHTWRLGPGFIFAANKFLFITLPATEYIVYPLAV
jgi:hypothetical protein